MHRRLQFSVSLALLLACAGLARADDPFFLGFGEQTGGLYRRPFITGISGDGSVVVGFGVPALRTDGEGFAWTVGGSVRGLGYLPGYDNSPTADVSFDGTVIAGYGYEPGAQAYRWTESTGPVGLGFLPGGEERSEASALSADGSVVVGWGATPVGLEAFRWTAAGGMVSLGDLPGGRVFGFGWDVSADGSVAVGWSDSAPGTEAFRWTAAGGMVGLGDLPGGEFSSRAKAVSADGSLIVGTATTAEGVVAFRWTEQTGMLELEQPPDAISSEPTGVSADGRITVGYSRLRAPGGATRWEAVIWDEGQSPQLLHDLLVNQYGLNLTGWDLWLASDISADGLTIAGYALNPAGERDGWVAHIPEPATALWLGPALLLVLRRRPLS